MHSTLGRNQSFHSYCIYHMFPIIEKCCSDSATDSALFANITLPLALASAVLHSHFVLSICCSIYTRRNLLLRVLFNGKWDCCGKCMPLVAKHLTHFHSSHCCYTVSLYNKWKCLLLLIVYTQIVLWHFGFRRKFTERNRFPPIFERSNGNALEIGDKKIHFKHVMSHCKACIICQVLKTHANVHGWYFFPKQCEKKCSISSSKSRLHWYNDPCWLCSEMCACVNVRQWIQFVFIKWNNSKCACGFCVFNSTNFCPFSPIHNFCWE